MTASPRSYAYDVLAVGRSSIDLYAHEIGRAIADVRSFDAYVGGCPTNVSVGTRRLGLRSALLTAVGDDQIGDFVTAFLDREREGRDALLRLVLLAREVRRHAGPRHPLVGALDPVRDPIDVVIGPAGECHPTHERASAGVKRGVQRPQTLPGNGHTLADVGAVSEGTGKEYRAVSRDAHSAEAVTGGQSDDQVGHGAADANRLHAGVIDREGIVELDGSQVGRAATIGMESVGNRGGGGCGVGRRCTTAATAVPLARFRTDLPSDAAFSMALSPGAGISRRTSWLTRIQRHGSSPRSRSRSAPPPLRSPRRPR